MRLGFAVQVLGRPQLKSHDSRRWQNTPHLSVSLAYLRDILLYLREIDIHMYRMHADLAPYIGHPDLAQFHGQIEECEQELAYVGNLARKADIRLSFHVDPYTVLNSANEEVGQRSAQKLSALAQMLDAMGLADEAVVVTHVGGTFGDKEESVERFVRRYELLPKRTQKRLVLENDEDGYSLIDVYQIHQVTGARVVFDRLHFLLNNPDQISLRDGLQMALSTWPADVRPKVHFSSPRTEMVMAPIAAGQNELRPVKSPLWKNHSDYINPFEFIDFLRLAEGCRPFDVMLEAKGKDLAVLKLRDDLAEFAPDLCCLREQGSAA